MFNSGVIAASGASDAGLISEFTFTAGQYTADSKNYNRGFQRSGLGGSFQYGSVTETSYDLAGGITIDLVNSNGIDPPLNYVGSSLYEYDPQSGSEIVVMAMFAKGHANGMPTFNDANFFKTLKIINNTTNSTATIARSDFTVSTNTSNSTDSFMSIQKTQTIGIANTNSITVQLRSD